MRSPVVFRFQMLQIPASKSLRKLVIPWIIEPSSPMFEFVLTAWTSEIESDSMITWLSPLSRARRIPSSTAIASVVFASSPCSLLLLPCPCSHGLPHLHWTDFYSHQLLHQHLSYKNPEVVLYYHSSFVVILGSLCILPDLGWGEAMRRLMDHLISVIPDGSSRGKEFFKIMMGACIQNLQCNVHKVFVLCQ